MPQFVVMYVCLDVANDVFCLMRHAVQQGMFLCAWHQRRLMSTVTLICTNSMSTFFSSSGSESTETETDNEEEETVMLEKQPSPPQ